MGVALIDHQQKFRNDQMNEAKGPAKARGLQRASRGRRLGESCILRVQRGRTLQGADTGRATRRASSA